MLKTTYAAGQTVAITNATADEGQQLRTVLGYPNAAKSPSLNERADLIFFRKAPRPGTAANDYSTGIFHPPLHTATLPVGQQPDEYTIEALSQIFSETAVVPQASLGPAVR
jgi:hypothetical protein